MTMRTLTTYRQYDFEDVNRIFPYSTYAYTEHAGIHYSLYYYPLPGCAITSVQALSGKTVAYQTWSNTQAYDKRQAEVTELWDYEYGTLFANDQLYRYTVYQGTHTCYENCDTWFTYYYPDGVGTPGPAWTTESTPLSSVPTPTPTPTPTPESTFESTPLSSAPTSAPVSSSAEVPVSSTPSVEESSYPETTSTLPAETPADIPSTESGAAPTGASTTPSPTSGTTTVNAPNGSSTGAPLPTAEAHRPAAAQFFVALVMGMAVAILAL
jgi:hypothetical protein